MAEKKPKPDEGEVPETGPETPPIPTEPEEPELEGDPRFAGRVVWKGRGTRHLTAGDLQMLGYEGDQDYEFFGNRETAVPVKLQNLLIDDKRLPNFFHP